MTEQSYSIRMLRIEQVEEKVGYKKSTIFEWMKTGSPRYKSHFPLPRKNGRSNRWFESEIDDFCILEFGSSKNHPVIERERAVNSRREFADLPAPFQGDAIKTKSESTAPSGKAILGPVNMLEQRATVEQGAGPTMGVGTDVSAAKIAGPVLDEPQRPVAAENGTETIKQAEATGTKRVIGVIVTKRRTFVQRD